jgi:hypothetical protein
MGKHTITVLVISILAALRLFGQDMIPVYLEPNPQSPILTLLRFDDPMIQDSGAINDSSLAKKGWRSTRYNGNFRGFVSGDEITRSGDIKEGSAVYLRKSKSSMELTRISSGDNYTIIRKGEWVEIDFEKPVSVYFQDDRFYADVPSAPQEPLSIPPVSVDDTQSARILGEVPIVDEDPVMPELAVMAASIPQNASAPIEPIDLPSTLIQPYEEETMNQAVQPIRTAQSLEPSLGEPIQNDMIDPIGLNEPVGLEKKPVAVNEEALPELDPIGGDDFDAEELKIETPTIKPPSSLSRKFEGKLIYKPASILLKTKYEYQLISPAGHRIAFVDVENLHVHKLHAYRDLYVILDGQLESIENSKHTVIRARLLRLRP